MRPWALSAVLLSLTAAGIVTAQQTEALLRVEVRSESLPVPGATVTLGKLSAQTDDRGVAVLATGLGTVEIKVAKPGFHAANTSLLINLPQQWDIVVELQ